MRRERCRWEKLSLNSDWSAGSCSDCLLVEFAAGFVFGAGSTECCLTAFVAVVCCWYPRKLFRCGALDVGCHAYRMVAGEAVGRTSAGSAGSSAGNPQGVFGALPGSWAETGHAGCHGDLAH